MEPLLTIDQQVFVDSTRRYLDTTCPTSALRARRDDSTGFDARYWRDGADLGWTSLLVDEAAGGGSVSGEGARDVALVGFEFGRHAAPGPLVGSNVVAAALSGSERSEHQEVLAALLTGQQSAAWCYSEALPNTRLGAVAVHAARESGAYRLSGVKQPVEMGLQPDRLLVTARSDAGLVQLLVSADAPGVVVTPINGLDLTRRFAEVRLQDVIVPDAAVVGDDGTVDADVERQLQLALVIELAEMVGAMDKAFEITVEWAFNRYSFGRPLASYQELKHRFADMRSWLEAGHAIVDACARHVQVGSPRASEMVSVGKSFLGAYGPELVQDCVQMHGGIGVTFEHDLHLFLRRVVLGSVLLGTVSDHRQRLAAILEGREKPHG